jgi:hypothetical protein
LFIRLKFENNALLNFDLMIDLVVTRTVMRLKLKKNIFMEFQSHDQSVDLLIKTVKILL